MSVAIYPIPLSIDCCYVIRDRGAILIDAGLKRRVGRLARALDRVGMRPEEIRLMVITHGHFDHIGSAKAIEDLTGAKIAMHQPDARWLEQSIRPRISGVTPWGRIWARVLNWPLPLMRSEPAKVDIVLNDDDWPLGEYGIRGKVLWTPGHTMGSVSVLLESGEAFVGDLAMNGVPLRFTPGLPILAEDINRVLESWRKVIDAGARVIYPAHGKPFPVEVMKRMLREVRAW